MVLVSYKPINTIVLVGLIVMVRHFLHSGRKCATLPGTEESMNTTIEFITALFCQVDDHLSDIPKHPEAHLWPREVVTLGLLHRPQRRGQPCLLSLVDARLSVLVSPAPRAHPALSSPHDPSGLDAGFLGPLVADGQFIAVRRMSVRVRLCQRPRIQCVIFVACQK
jgi:hypothetical protein